MASPRLHLEVQNAMGTLEIPDITTMQHCAQHAYRQDESTSVTLRIVDHEESQILNHTYRGKNRPTNILSFPYDAPDIPDQENYLGDLVLCHPVVMEEAKAQGKALDDHWMHLLIHGMLHLQGYDHISAKDAEIMETLEIELLQQLGINNPYL